MKKRISIILVVVVMLSFCLTVSAAPPECPNLNPECPGFLDIYLGCSGTIKTTSSVSCPVHEACTAKFYYCWDITGCDLSCGYTATNVSFSMCYTTHTNGPTTYWH